MGAQAACGEVVLKSCPVCSGHGGVLIANQNKNGKSSPQAKIPADGGICPVCTVSWSRPRSTQAERRPLPQVPPDAGLCPVCTMKGAGKIQKKGPGRPPPQAPPDPQLVTTSFASKVAPEFSKQNHANAVRDDESSFKDHAKVPAEAVTPNFPDFYSQAKLHHHADHTEVEPEPAPEDRFDEKANDVDVIRERMKASMAMMAVIAFWLVLFSVLSWFNLHFKDPDCEADADYYEVHPPRSCKRCAAQLIFLPLFKHWERSWPEEFRAVLYTVIIVWVFLGIAIVCDHFMSAIEEITNTRKVRWINVHPGTRHRSVVKVWNPTVANLTLMALGSSAPEILLATIEIIGFKFFAGPLGPPTIVGSAAFNLLIITAVCLSEIPAPDTRRIEGTDVFIITAFFSVFAYVWVLLCLKIHSPDKIDIGEAVLTFALFPVFVWLSYCADRGRFERLKFWKVGSHEFPVVIRDRNWMERQVSQIRAKYGNDLPKEVLYNMLQKIDASANETTSRAQLRKHVMKRATGSCYKKEAIQVPTFGFEEAEVVVLENAGTLTLKVIVSAPLNIQLRYQTREGSAKPGARYVHTEGILQFKPGLSDRTIDIPIIDDDVYQPDEHFFCEIMDVSTNVSGSSSASHSSTNLSRLGIPMVKIIIQNDDMPGTLGFEVPEVYGTEGMAVVVGIVRTHGTTGSIQCEYKVQDETSPNSDDHETAWGKVQFKHGEVYKTIKLEFKKTDLQREGTRQYKVMLYNPSAGVQFDKIDDNVPLSSATGGMIECNPSCRVVVPTAVYSNLGFTSRLRKTLFNKGTYKHVLNLWADQMAQAIYCQGSAEEQSTSTAMHWFLHLLSVTFKVLFAFIPPSPLFGGWCCFFGALGMIGVVTAVVGDLATMLGCCIGIPDDITAITLVALGTSLPDTFASKLAAQESTADNAIGNVTGSNSVNVFLGLGLPWTIAAIYWKLKDGPTDTWLKYRHGEKSFKTEFLPRYPDGGFIVPAGSLAINVLSFSVCAILCLGLLTFRRIRYGGELGGPKMTQTRDSCILVFLWFVYVAISSTVSLTESE